MKTALDPRHQHRRKVVKELFAESFTDQSVSEVTKKILSRKLEIDKKIEAAAPQWPIEKLNKIDAAILRLAVYEIMEAKVPEKVVIDEAIELAKEYGADASASFVNGVLGKIVSEKPEAKLVTK